MLVNSIAKISSFDAKDFPKEFKEIKGRSKILQHLADSPGTFIYLDNPIGSKKSFGDEDLTMPFDYGELHELINPADDMGWDVIIVPSAKGLKKISDDGLTGIIEEGHALMPIGYVPVNEDQEEWKKNTATKSRPNGKTAPIGNDKIILAPDGSFTDSDIKIIESFFKDLWVFKEVVWLQTL